MSELVPAWKPPTVVELVTENRVVVVLEELKKYDVDVIVEVEVFVRVEPEPDPEEHEEGQYSVVKVFPLAVRRLTYTSPEVRQLTQAASCMPMLHPVAGPHPVMEPVPSPGVNVSGSVMFRSPVTWPPLTRNSDPMSEGLVEEESAFPEGVVTKTAVMVTGTLPEFSALTPRTQPAQLVPDPGPTVTTRFSPFAPCIPSCLPTAPCSAASEEVLANR